MATVTKNPTYPTSPTRTGSACSTTPPTRATPPSSLRFLRRGEPRGSEPRGVDGPARGACRGRPRCRLPCRRRAQREVLSSYALKAPSVPPPRYSRRATLSCTSRGSSSPGCPLSGGSSRATRFTIAIKRERVLPTVVSISETRHRTHDPHISSRHVSASCSRRILRPEVGIKSCSL